MNRLAIAVLILAAAGLSLAGTSPVMTRPGAHPSRTPFFVQTIKGARTTIPPPVTKVLTFAAAAGDATKTTSGLIPKGAVLTGITTRVNVTGTTCTSINIGDGADPDLYAVTAPVAVNGVTGGANTKSYTAVWSNPQLSTSEVTVTGVGGNCVDLVIAVTAHYTTVSAATSN